MKDLAPADLRGRRERHPDQRRSGHRTGLALVEHNSSDLYEADAAAPAKAEGMGYAPRHGIRELALRMVDFSGQGQLWTLIAQ